MADEDGRTGRSAAWGVAAGVFGACAIATWQAATAPKSTFPISPTFIFGSVAALALYMCFSTIWRWWPTVRLFRGRSPGTGEILLANRSLDTTEVAGNLCASASSAKSASGVHAALSSSTLGTRNPADSPEGQAAQMGSTGSDGRKLGSGYKTLYLTSRPSAYNHDAFEGLRLARNFQEKGSLLVRYWFTESRESAIARLADLQADATDENEFTEFSPDIIFLEGGLYSNGHDWRVPPDVVAGFLHAGGVMIVADVERNELYHNFESYLKDLPFFGAKLFGDPLGRDDIKYVRDDDSNDGTGSCILCEQPYTPEQWIRDCHSGIGQVLAVNPVALTVFAGETVLWSASTASVLRGDRYIEQRIRMPLAVARRHGLGYSVIVGARVSPDRVTDTNPANLQWLVNVATVLSSRAAEEQRLRKA